MNFSKNILIHNTTHIPTSIYYIISNGNRVFLTTTMKRLIAHYVHYLSNFLIKLTLVKKEISVERLMQFRFLTAKKYFAFCFQNVYLIYLNSKEQNSYIYIKLCINFYMLLIIGHEVKVIQDHLSYAGDKTKGDSRVRLYLSFICFF